MSHRNSLSRWFATVAVAIGVGCTGAPGEDGLDGTDGASGSVPLVSVIAEAAGPDCPGGGRAVRTGSDDNGNGVLDDAEIASTAYVCDGVPAAVALLRLELSAPGDHCSAGGTRVLAGADANADGVLQDAEVTSTSYVCGGVEPAPCDALEGSLTIRNGEDWHLLAASGCTEITGDLVIVARGLASLQEPTALMAIGRNLRVVGNGDLTSLELPSLASIGGDLEIRRNASLLGLSLPALTELGGGLTVSDNPLLPQCLATALADRLSAAGWTGTPTFSGNDETATCP